MRQFYNFFLLAVSFAIDAGLSDEFIFKIIHERGSEFTVVT